MILGGNFIKKFYKNVEDYKYSSIDRSINHNHILQDIDLTIKQGQAIGLVGPNGCGKTSLLNIISGFHQPDKGSIHFLEQAISHKSISERANLGIGRVFQHFGIFKKLTIYENLALAYISKLSRRQKLLLISFLNTDKKEKINEILHEIGLYEKRNQLAGDLSGGQMRLLEIARLYLQDTKLFLFDEPTAGVSPKLKNKVIELIKKIIGLGKTVIIVEHDFNFLAEFVDTIYVMNDGKIVLQGSYDKIKDSETLKEIYFGNKN